MTDIALEVFRAVVVLIILLALFRGVRSENIRQTKGWRCLLFGFVLIFFGSLIDISDNFEGLNKFIILGDTPAQAILEKVVGYLLGFTLVAIGISRWLPKISEHQLIIQENMEKTKKENLALRGFLPICSHCNNIRNDEGKWDKMETYIEKRSDAKFSHSICDTCLDIHYPEDED